MSTNDLFEVFAIDLAGYSGSPFEKMGAALRDLDTFRKERNQLSAELRLAQQENAHLRGKLFQAEDARDALQGELNTAQRKLERLRADFVLLQEQRDILNRDVDNLHSAIRSYLNDQLQKV